MTSSVCCSTPPTPRRVDASTREPLMPNVGHNRPSGVIQNDLVFDEIRAIVAEANKSKSVLKVSSHVERLG